MFDLASDIGKFSSFGMVLNFKFIQSSSFLPKTIPDFLEPHRFSGPLPNEIIYSKFIYILFPSKLKVI